MKDRITVAWELRREIHAWIMQNRASTMQELLAVFPNHPDETIRKAVARLRTDGDVMMNGRRGIVGRLFALTAHIRPEWFKRQALMTSGMNMSADKFEQAEAVRQRILDICNRDGRCTSKSVSEELDINFDHALRSLNRMAEEGEVAKHGKSRGIVYTPLKEKTMSADEMRLRAENRKKISIEKDIRKQAAKTKKAEPWRYIHRGMDRDTPIPSQGGQGAIRREFGIQASAGML